MIAVRIRPTKTRDPLLVTARWARSVGQTNIYAVFAFALVRYTNYSDYAITSGSTQIANVFSS
jgi:hypothetical protein